MRHAVVRGTVAALALLGLAGCHDVPGVEPPAAPAAAAPVEAKDAVDWDALLLRMQEADRIADDVERCLRYPDVPGLSWSPALLEARCALQRSPRYDLAALDGLVGTRAGRATLERHFDELLAAHYADPGQRDQISLAFGMFDQRLEARDTAKRWQAASPGSAYANLAYGLALLETAHAARGEYTAAVTPPEDLARMRVLADEAGGLFARAHAAVPRLTPACVGRVRVARLSRKGDDPLDLARRCAQQDPLSYFAAMAWAGAAEPRWGGSAEELEAIAQHALAHREKNPVMDSVRAAAASDRFFDEEPVASDLAPMEEVARTGPNSKLLNQISAGWGAQRDEGRHMAYLSQAVRFEIGRDGPRAYRIHVNHFRRPEWAILDLEHALRRDPGSPLLRQQLAQARENVRTDSAAHMARGGRIVLEGDSMIEQMKAMKQQQCEDYGLAGKTSSEVMDRCTDALVAEYPEDAESWRVRADVLHLRGDPLALEAARKYLDLATPDAPLHAARTARYAGWLKQGARPGPAQRKAGG